MGIFREMARILYPWPINCRCCGENTYDDHVLCPACRREIRNDGATWGFAKAPITRSVAAHHYTEMSREMVRLLKYNSLSDLAIEMADDMIQAAERADIAHPDIITYVPMHARRRRQKFFDQAEILARHVAAAVQMQDSKALKRVRYSRQQARTCGYAARMKNVENAFSVQQDVEGKHVLLIDDVYTTGATSSECARVLMEAGACRVDLLVYAIAADPPERTEDAYSHADGINMQ